MSRIRDRLTRCLLVLPLAAVAACGSTGGQQPAPGASTAPVKVAGTVIGTATSTNEAQVVVPDPVAAAWRGLGGHGSGVELVSVSGDAKAARTPFDLTTQPDQAAGRVAADLNGDAAQADGRSALAGLDAVSSPAGSPVWVFSPLLDTTGALDFDQLAFDTSPATVVKAMKKQGQLPKLKGRDVTFVVTPAAGAQKKLSRLQVGYQRAVWEDVARAGGAKRVTFYDGTGTGAGTGTISPVPVPDPNDAIKPVGSGPTRTCTLPAPALFVADQPTLIDKAATRRELKGCLGSLASSTKITVEGHTAGVAGADNTFAKNLSTQRATEVAALLKELDVPARNIVKVAGYGSEKPLVQPASSPKNRAVVVTFSTTG